MLKLLSINVGQPRQAEWQGRTFTTSIFKSPVAGSVRIAGVNVAGDSQSEPVIHGGPTMAVYAFPSEHYAAWRHVVTADDFHWGAFGENLTLAGLLETDARIGDRLRVGTAELTITQPRTPCFKLQMRLGYAGALKQMTSSRQTGFYLTISKPGEAAAGDPVERIARPDHNLTIDDLVRLGHDKSANPAELAAAAACPDLTDEWRDRLRKRLD